jgi:hypothetical protein
LNRLNSTSDSDQQGEKNGKDAFAMLLQRRYSHGSNQTPSYQGQASVSGHVHAKLPDLPESNTKHEERLSKTVHLSSSKVVQGESASPLKPQPSVSVSADIIPMLQLSRASSSMRKQQHREEKLKQLIEFKSSDGILALYTPRKHASSRSLLNGYHEEPFIPSELPDLSDVKVPPSK